MSSVNKVILIGNLGRDPEKREFQGGGSVVTMAIATSESWKDKNSGERKERTEWHNIAIMSEGLQKIATQYLRKGSKVYVEGQLRTRKWQAQDGSDRYSTEIVVNGPRAVMTLLDKREGDPGRHDYSGYQDEGRSSGAGAAGGERQVGPHHHPDLDDEVPF